MDNESSRNNMLESLLKDGSSEKRNLTLEYLRNITNNFADERLLGEGGFGTVYKGVLPNGEMIAVKKFNLSTPQVMDRQFENEACHLMRLNHPNVVPLVGWCSETEDIYVQHNGEYICAEKSERLLCLEYMPKGSLREYISDEASGLGWNTRYKIIEGICYGLHYLHEEWQPGTPIIHMDLKPPNILLDNNMVPKIADFGMSRLFSEEKTWTCTINRYGTLGYMAPEYINRGLITTKSDIFSLGVIIIELVTGRKDYPDETEVSSQEFIELVLKNWRNRLQKTVGYKEELDYQQIRRCIQIGLVCVELDRSKRPTTSQIIKMLHAESADFSVRKKNTQSWLRRLLASMTKGCNSGGQYRFQETHVPKLDYAKESKKILGIGSVLIATVTFAAAFTVPTPGGYRQDDNPNAGAAMLAGSYAFDAFIISNTMAFVCSSLATCGLMYSGTTAIDIRAWYFTGSLILLLSSVGSLGAAFALGIYVTLAPVAGTTAAAICAITSALVLFGNRLIPLTVTWKVSLRLRLGARGGCAWDWVLRSRSTTYSSNVSPTST